MRLSAIVVALEWPVLLVIYSIWQSVPRQKASAVFVLRKRSVSNLYVLIRRNKITDTNRMLSMRWWNNRPTIIQKHVDVGVVYRSIYDWCSNPVNMVPKVFLGTRLWFDKWKLGNSG
jgi:hypothetical protein